MHSMRFAPIVRPLIVALAAAGALGALGVTATQASPGAMVGQSAEPTVEEIFAKCVEAVGGREAVDEIKTLHCTMTISMMGQKQEMEQFWARDGGRLVKTSTQFGEMQMGTNGETAWMKGPNGYMLVPEEQAKQIDSQAGMLMSMIDPKNFAKRDLGKVEYVGTETFADAECHKLSFTSESGGNGHIFYNVESGLPAGIQENAAAPGQPSTTLKLSDWKPVGDVKFFRTITIEAGQAPQAGELTVSGLEINALEDDVFALPPEVEELAKQQGDDAAGTEVKLEDLSPEMQRQATETIENAKKQPGTEQLQQTIAVIEKNLSAMPAEQKTMLQYVLQELKKELASRDG